MPLARLYMGHIRRGGFLSYNYIPRNIFHTKQNGVDKPQSGKDAPSARLINYVKKISYLCTTIEKKTTKQKQHQTNYE